MGYYKGRQRVIRGRPFGRLGDASDNYALAEQTLQELPSIMGAATGVSTSTTTAAGTTSTGSNIIPPGFGITASASPILWIGGAVLLIGVLAVAFRSSKR